MSKEQNEAWVKFYHEDGTWFKRYFFYEDNENVTKIIEKYAKDYNLRYEYLYFTK
jgi:hypothetical protein